LEVDGGAGVVLFILLLSTTLVITLVHLCLCFLLLHTLVSSAC
jgi:hypothetical protein